MTTVANLRSLTPEQAALIPGLVYVGRRVIRSRHSICRAPSPLANPFRGTDALHDYLRHLAIRPDLLDLARALKGSCLACWCVNDPTPGTSAIRCHAQILAIIADEQCTAEDILAGLQQEESVK